MVKISLLQKITVENDYCSKHSSQSIPVKNDSSEGLLYIYTIMHNCILMNEYYE